MNLFFWLSFAVTPVLALLIVAVARADPRVLRVAFSPAVAEKWRAIAVRTRLLVAVGPSLALIAAWLVYELLARRSLERADASVAFPLLVWLSLLWIVQAVPRWRRPRSSERAADGSDSIRRR